MQATLTWLDLTASDRDKMRRVLDLFKEQGTLDELGLGSLRDALSDALFPGTSSIETRLRYVLFIPWLYRRLEDRSAGCAGSGPGQPRRSGTPCHRVMARQSRRTQRHQGGRWVAKRPATFEIVAS